MPNLYVQVDRVTYGGAPGSTPEEDPDTVVLHRGDHLPGDAPDEVRDSLLATGAVGETDPHAEPEPALDPNPLAPPPEVLDDLSDDDDPFSDHAHLYDEDDA